MSNKRKFQRKPRISGNTNLLTTKSIKSNIKNPMTGTDDRSQCPTGTPDSQCGCCCYGQYNPTQDITIILGHSMDTSSMTMSNMSGENAWATDCENRGGAWLGTGGPCSDYSGVGNACPYTYGQNGTNQPYPGNVTNSIVGCSDPSAFNYNPNYVIGFPEDYCDYDDDLDGIPNSQDDCFGQYDECGVCNGDGMVYGCQDHTGDGNCNYGPCCQQDLDSCGYCPDHVFYGDASACVPHTPQIHPDKGRCKDCFDREGLVAGGEECRICWEQFPGGVPVYKKGGSTANTFNRKTDDDSFMFQPSERAETGRSICPNGSSGDDCGCCCYPMYIAGQGVTIVLGNAIDIRGMYGLGAGEDIYKDWCLQKNGAWLGVGGSCERFSGSGNECPYTYGTGGIYQPFPGDQEATAVGCMDDTACNYSDSAILGFMDDNNPYCNYHPGVCDDNCYSDAGDVPVDVGCGCGIEKNDDNCCPPNTDDYGCGCGNDDSCQDCAGVANGPGLWDTQDPPQCCSSGVFDLCGVCDGTCTGPGTGIMDVCGICGGSYVFGTTLPVYTSSGITTGDFCDDGSDSPCQIVEGARTGPKMDCKGVCGGTATFDECGICGGVGKCSCGGGKRGCCCCEEHEDYTGADVDNDSIVDCMDDCVMQQNVDQDCGCNSGTMAEYTGVPAACNCYGHVNDICGNCGGYGVQECKEWGQPDLGGGAVSSWPWEDYQSQHSLPCDCEGNFCDKCGGCGGKSDCLNFCGKDPDSPMYDGSSCSDNFSINDCPASPICMVKWKVNPDAAALVGATAVAQSGGPLISDRVVGGPRYSEGIEGITPDVQPTGKLPKPRGSRVKQDLFPDKIADKSLMGPDDDGGRPDACNAPFYALDLDGNYDFNMAAPTWGGYVRFDTGEEFNIQYWWGGAYSNNAWYIEPFNKGFGCPKNTDPHSICDHLSGLGGYCNAQTQYFNPTFQVVGCADPQYANMQNGPYRPFCYKYGNANMEVFYDSDGDLDATVDCIDIHDPECCPGGGGSPSVNNSGGIDGQTMHCVYQPTCSGPDFDCTAVGKQTCAFASIGDGNKYTGYCKWYQGGDENYDPGSGDDDNDDETDPCVDVAVGDAPGVGSFRCGGSLIAQDWILTAAHCCHGMMNPYSDAGMGSETGMFNQAVIGMHNTNWAYTQDYIDPDTGFPYPGAYAEGMETMGIDGVVIHPFYTPGSETWDYCLLHLSTPAPRRFKPVRINTSKGLEVDGNPLVAIGAGVTVPGLGQQQVYNLIQGQVCPDGYWHLWLYGGVDEFGWFGQAGATVQGHDANLLFSPTLQEITVPVDGTCGDWVNWNDFIESPSQFCAGGCFEGCEQWTPPEGYGPTFEPACENICDGDSGGPNIMWVETGTERLCTASDPYKDENCEPLLVGITGVMPYKCDCASHEGNYPPIFSSVAQASDWIKETMRRPEWTDVGQCFDCGFWTDQWMYQFLTFFEYYNASMNLAEGPEACSETNSWCNLMEKYCELGQNSPMHDGGEWNMGTFCQWEQGDHIWTCPENFEAVVSGCWGGNCDDPLPCPENYSINIGGRCVCPQADNCCETVQLEDINPLSENLPEWMYHAALGSGWSYASNSEGEYTLPPDSRLVGGQEVSPACGMGGGPDGTDANTGMSTCKYPFYTLLGIGFPIPDPTPSTICPSGTTLCSDGKTCETDMCKCPDPTCQECAEQIGCGNWPADACFNVCGTATMQWVCSKDIGPECGLYCDCDIDGTTETFAGNHTECIQLGICNPPGPGEFDCHRGSPDWPECLQYTEIPK